MGQESSIEDLYATHGPAAKRLAFLLTGDEELAQDLVQEAFVRILGRFANLAGPDRFALYLRRTVINLAHRHWRRRDLEKRLLAREDIQRGPEGSGLEMPDIETREALWKALLLLPPRQRAALVLRFYEDFSEARVAEALDCSVGAAKQLTSRGLAALRATLPDEAVT